MLLDQVSQTITRQAMFRTGDHVLVAVSGGADSIALLALLHQLAPRWRLRLTVAHLDHRIRGAAARSDAAFVRKIARSLGLAYVIGCADVPQQARRSGVSLEMAGRQARYAFLERVARARRCTALATAHTADDQVETILMNLARGTGPQGLAGIPSVGWRQNLKVVRPLREFRRREIVSFLQERRLAWREDASNRDLDFLRNRVRHEILPFLEKRLNPQFRTALLRLGEIVAKENAWLDEQAQLTFRSLTQRRPSFVPLHLNHGLRRTGKDAKTKKHIDKCALAPWRLGVKNNSCPTLYPPRPLNAFALRACPPALRRRVLRLWLTDSGLPPDTIDFDAIKRLDDLVMNLRSGRTASLPGGRQARREYQELILEPCGVAADISFAVSLKIPGMTRLPEPGLRITTSIAPGIFREKPRGIGVWPARASLSLAAWRRRPITARSWQTGDRMAPLGLGGMKKLQDIFSDLKVPAAERHRIPLLICGEEIIWLPGYRIARGWEVKSPRENALQVQIEVAPRTTQLLKGRS